jgi:hypothetical protein
VAGRLLGRYSIRNPTVIVHLLRVVARKAHDARSSQTLQQFFLQGAAVPDEEAAVGGFVWHQSVLVAGVPVRQPSGYLLWRP